MGGFCAGLVLQERLVAYSIFEYRNGHAQEQRSLSSAIHACKGLSVVSDQPCMGRKGHTMKQAPFIFQPRMHDANASLCSF